MAATAKKPKTEKVFDRFILGEDDRCHISTDTDETELNNNILVVGGSGSGKTTSVVAPILLHLNNSNAIGIFTKRSMMDKMAYVLKKRGYTVRVMDFDDPSRSEYGFDPLSYCKSEGDVRSLAHSVIYQDIKKDNSKDPYWNISAENLLNVILRYVWNGHYSKGRSMAAALKLLDGVVWRTQKSSASSLDLFLEDDEDREKRIKQEEKELDERYPTYFEMKRLEKADPGGNVFWRSFINLPQQTGASVVSCLQTPLRKMFNPEVRKILEKKEKIDFSEFLKPKQAVFLYISPTSEAQHRYVSLFYRQIFKNLFELAEKQKDYALPYPAHIICDDFATGCKVNEFDELISIFREKRISVTLLLQSESQLVGIYGKNAATTIINNCDTYIYLGAMDLPTCENISLRLDRELSEVLSMPVGTEYFFRRGKKPIVTKRYNLFLDPQYIRYFGDETNSKSR